MLVPFTKVRYDEDTAKDNKKMSGSRMAAGMAPDQQTDQTPNKSTSKLVEEGITYIRHDAVQMVSPMRYDDKNQCSEIVLNSGDKVLVKEMVSEVFRVLTQAG